MGSKMTQIQAMISSVIIHVRKNWFHSLLAKCLLCKNGKLFIAKRSVYNCYHTLFTSTSSLRVTAVTARQPAATRLSVGRLGRATQCARNPIRWQWQDLGHAVCSRLSRPWSVASAERMDDDERYRAADEQGRNTASACRPCTDTFTAQGVNSQHSTPAGRPLQVVALWRRLAVISFHAESVTGAAAMCCINYRLLPDTGSVSRLYGGFR